MPKTRQNFKEFSKKRATLMDWILKQIQGGHFKPGDPIPSRTNLAKTFNCSYATVDFVLKSLIKNQVLVAEQGKGTYVALPRERTVIDAIAVINCNPVFSWSAEIEQGLIQGLGNEVETGRFSIFDLQLPANWESVKSHKAIVFIMPEAHHYRYLEELRFAKIPHLVLYRDLPESPFISIDFRAAGEAVVAALKAKGCTRFAWVSRTESRYKTPEERFEGFLSGLLLNGLSYKKEWASFYKHSEEAAYLRSLFVGPERPDGLVVAQTLLGPVVKALQEAGLEPGKEVQLAYMDEVEAGQYHFPVLCTQKLTRETGLEAARLLLSGQNLVNGHSAQSYLTPVVLEK